MGEIIGQPDLQIEAPLFTFRPVTHDDLGLIFIWVQDPEISRWWGKPPLTQSEIDGKYIPCIDGSEQVACLIAEYEGRPFAYLQWYLLRDHLDHPALPFAAPDFAGLDLFISALDDRNRGFGSLMTRQFITETLLSHPDIAGFVIDPSVDNHRAIAAYRKAGFVDVGTGPDAETGEPCLIQIAYRASVLGERRPYPTGDPADAEQHQK